MKYHTAVVILQKVFFCFSDMETVVHTTKGRGGLKNSSTQVTWHVRLFLLSYKMTTKPSDKREDNKSEISKIPNPFYPSDTALTDKKCKKQTTHEQWETNKFETLTLQRGCWVQKHDHVDAGKPSLNIMVEL